MWAEKTHKNGPGQGIRRFGRATLAALGGVLLACVSTVAPATAAGLIRDAETEDLMRDYARPIFQAAGLSAQNIRIHLVNNKAFNAFVVDGQNMFFNVGALTSSKTPNMLIGVLAHETGHIAGGHLARLRSNLKKAQGLALVLNILTMGGAVGAAATGASDVGQVSQGAGQLGNATIQRIMLRYQRSEEAAADQAALRYLNATRQSARGMLQTFEQFADQGLASLRFVDPYLQSHPMPQTRIAQLRHLAKRSPYYNKKDPPALQLRHDLMRAKLIGFLEPANTVNSLYPRSDQSLPARYARAIATYHSEGILRFLPKINALLNEQPKNPYFWELKGEFLFKSGRPKEAVVALRKAVSLHRRSGLMRLSLAQAELATNRRSDLLSAIKNLKQALVQERESAQGFRLLAQAYGRLRKVGHAELASAHAYLFEGKLRYAKAQAARAKSRFKKGSPEWIKADDIINFRPHGGRGH